MEKVKSVQMKRIGKMGPEIPQIGRRRSSLEKNREGSMGKRRGRELERREGRFFEEINLPRIKMH